MGVLRALNQALNGFKRRLGRLGEETDLCLVEAPYPCGEGLGCGARKEFLIGFHFETVSVAKQASRLTSLPPRLTCA